MRILFRDEKYAAENVAILGDLVRDAHLTGNDQVCIVIHCNWYMYTLLANYMYNYMYMYMYVYIHVGDSRGSNDMQEHQVSQSVVPGRHHLNKAVELGT